MKIESGVIHDPRSMRFPFADPKIDPGPGDPLPPLEVRYQGLSNVAWIEQGDQRVMFCTRQVRKLIDQLEAVADDEDEDET